MNDAPDDAESVFLHDCLNIIVHDLGGVSGSLFLRADLLAMRGLDDDARVIRSIATEARDLGHHARLIGPPLRSSGTLGKQRGGDLNTWWPVVERFGRHFLPGGVTLDGHMNDLKVPENAVGPLSRITLALIRDVATRITATPVRLTMVATREEVANRVNLTLACSSSDGQPVVLAATDATSRWLSFARRGADTCETPLELSPIASGVTLTLPAEDS